MPGTPEQLQRTREQDLRHDMVRPPALARLQASLDGGQLDALHIRNFFDAIKRGAKLNSDILSGHQSTLLVQLGNISQRTGRALKIDPSNGRILNDKEAMKLWSREYEKGWEPKI